ncbi:hypothetical protein WDV93_08480 [Pantoea ananatis]
MPSASIPEDDDFRTLFDLKENEYLFSSEGLDLLGIGYFFEWLRGKPHSVVKDLSVGQLHQVLVKLRSKIREMTIVTSEAMCHTGHG